MKLRVEPAHGQAFDRVLDRDSTIVGRSSSADLTLADPFLSRHHARIFKEGSRYLIEDLGSRNGTLLNGVEVKTPMAIEPGDTVTVSGSTIKVVPADGDRYSQQTDEPITDIGATIFRPAAELLGEDSRSHPSEVEGEQALRRYAERLKLFNEIHEALTGSLSISDLLDLILERAFEHLKPEQGAIFLARGGNDYDRVAERSIPGIKGGMPLSRSLIEEVCDKGMAALVLDTATDARFAQAESIILSGVRSLIAAPLQDTESSLGMIVLSSRAAARQFEESDLEFLVSMASVAAMKIRNVKLTEEALQRRRLEEELALARRIQLSLLQEETPEIGGCELFADNIPSRGVSGDYYRLIERREGKELVLMVADVSGKGMGASILTASLEALSAGPIDDGHDTAKICAKVSKQLHQRTPPEKYATVFLAALAPASGALQYTNAGHNPGLIVRVDGKVELLEACGTPLGLLPVSMFEARETVLEPGDTLVLYTDGITEAENPAADEYGLERLSDVVQKNHRLELDQLAAAIEADLERFTEGHPVHDDRTLVMARRTG